MTPLPFHYGSSHLLLGLAPYLHLFFLPAQTSQVERLERELEGERRYAEQVMEQVSMLLPWLHSHWPHLL